MQVDIGLLQISGDVTEVGQPLELVSECPLRREMQQRPGVAQQLGAPLQDQPLRAVTLVRATAPAQGVGPVPIVSESREMMTTDRAENLVAAMQEHLRATVQTSNHLSRGQRAYTHRRKGYVMVQRDEVRPETWAIVAGRPEPVPGARLNTPVVAASTYVLGSDRI